MIADLVITALFFKELQRYLAIAIHIDNARLVMGACDESTCKLPCASFLEHLLI